jgi:hypothetical protein
VSLAGEFRRRHLDPPGDLQPVSTERHYANRDAVHECLLGRSHAAVGHGAHGPLQQRPVRDEPLQPRGAHLRANSVQRRQERLLHDAKDQRANQAIAKAAEQAAGRRQSG